MQRTICKPTVAVCAGDGTCASHLLRSPATANLTPWSLSRTVDWHSTINPAPACAYLAGTLALIRSQAHRAGTP
ncbi:MAG: hypothetical protein IT422_21630 [Pirellulaceae bacterium]|nr:hypothetical protein [Pirellulaceae bacterium]